MWATAPKARPRILPPAPPPHADTMSRVPTSLLSQAMHAGRRPSESGRGPRPAGRLSGPERPGAGTHHGASEPSRGAAILLSRGFPGDQDLHTSHWLILRGPLTNQQAAKEGIADCVGILLAHGDEELHVRLQIPECTVLRGQRSEGVLDAGT